MRIILDTNVFISGIFWEGNYCSALIDKWKEGNFELVSSLEIIEELVRVLREFKIGLDENEITMWRDFILTNSIIVQQSEKLFIVKDDPDDDKFIEAAVAGEVDVIVSQDKHLLQLKKYGSISIIAPKDAIEMLLNDRG